MASASQDPGAQAVLLATSSHIADNGDLTPQPGEVLNRSMTAGDVELAPLDTVRQEDSSHPAADSPQQDVLQQHVVRSETLESGGDDWFVKLENGQDSDKFGEYLEHKDKELFKTYQSFRLQHEFAFRSSFASFGLTLHPQPADRSRLNQDQDTETHASDQSVYLNAIVPVKAPSKRGAGVHHRLSDVIYGRSESAPRIESLSWSIKQFAEVLERRGENSFHLLLLARKSPGAAETFSYWKTLVSLFAKSIRKRMGIPFELVSHVLIWKRVWNASDKSKYGKTLSVQRMKSQLILPSQDKPVHHYGRKFTWPRSMPSSGRANLYIWRSYRQPVEFEVVEVLARAKSDTDWIVHILFETTAGLSDLFDDIRPRYNNLDRFKVTDNVLVSFEKEYNAILVVLIFKTVRKVKHFLEWTNQALEGQELAARDRPTRGQYLFLVQLQDFVNSMTISIRECLMMLESFNPSHLTESDVDKIDLLEKDCIFLRDNLLITDEMIRKLDERLEKLANFRQLQHSSITNLLLALFIPMAFVTSFFGMNTVEINGSNWTLATFWTIAIPLTVGTIILPAIFGPLLRFSAQTGVEMWRMLKILFPFTGTVLLYTSALFALLAGVDDMLYTSSSMALFLSSMAFGAFFNAIAAVALGEPLISFRVIWSLCIGITATVCAGLNQLDSLRLVTSVIPVSVVVVPGGVVIMLYCAGLCLHRRPPNSRNLRFL